MHTTAVKRCSRLPIFLLLQSIRMVHRDVFRIFLFSRQKLPRPPGCHRCTMSTPVARLNCWKTFPFLPRKSREGKEKRRAAEWQGKATAQHVEDDDDDSDGRRRRSRWGWWCWWWWKWMRVGEKVFFKLCPRPQPSSIGPSHDDHDKLRGSIPILLPPGWAVCVCLLDSRRDLIEFSVENNCISVRNRNSPRLGGVAEGQRATASDATGRYTFV